MGQTSQCRLEASEVGWVVSFDGLSTHVGDVVSARNLLVSRISRIGVDTIVDVETAHGRWRLVVDSDLTARVSQAGVKKSKLGSTREVWVEEETLSLDTFFATYLDAPTLPAISATFNGGGLIEPTGVNDGDPSPTQGRPSTPTCPARPVLSLDLSAPIEPEPVCENPLGGEDTAVTHAALGQAIIEVLASRRELFDFVVSECERRMSEH